MNLTAQTTEEELVAPVQQAREFLAHELGVENPDSRTLLHRVHDVFAAEAVARLRYSVVEALQYDGSDRVERLNRLFVDILSRGADDTWSGRGNDAQRAAFDAVRSEIDSIRWSFRNEG